jgi:retinol dehydrogenase 12
VPKTQRLGALTPTRLREVKELMSKHILVTGAGRGLGRGVAIALAKAGHRVTCTVRSEPAGAAVVAEVKAVKPDARIEHRVLDLNAFASIRSFAAGLPSNERFDVLVHVAGVMQQSVKRRQSADGFEETLAVNTLAPFLLTHELRERLGGNESPGRVVCVSSRLHLPNSRGAPVRFEFEDPNLERDYEPSRAYKNSKLALLWFVFELARRTPRERFTVHGMCPGFVPETAAGSTTGVMKLVMRFLMPLMPFATSFRDAVDSICFTATDASLDAATGGFWAEKKPSVASEQARNQVDAKRFFEWACGVTGTGDWS